MLVAACGGGSSASPGTPGTLDIGSIWSLTGNSASSNILNYHVEELVVKDINSHGGINGQTVHVIYGDDQSDPGQGVVAAKVLINQDGIKILLGPGYTPPAVSVAQLAQANNIFMLSPGAQAPQLTSPLQHFIFAAYPTVTTAGQDIFQLMTSMNLSKPGLIAGTDAYGTNTIAATNAALPAGTKIVAQALLSPTATDATTQVAQMKSAGADVIIGGLSSQAEMASVFKAMDQQGLTIPYIGYTGFGGIEQVLSTYHIEAFYASPLACPITASCVAPFRNTFSAAFPNDPIAVQVFEADAVISAFFEDLKLAKSDAPEDVVKALETAPGYNSPMLPSPVKWTSTDHLGLHTYSFEGFKNGSLFFFGTNINQNHVNA